MTAVCLLSQPVKLYSIEEPALPSVPAVQAPEDQKKAYRVIIVFASGDQVEGLLHLAHDTINIHIHKESGTVISTESILNIHEISFLKWKGTDRGPRGFIFNTSHLEISLKKDGARITAQRIPCFDRFILETSKGRKIYYSYFYDYYIQGVWKNSGSPDKTYPETRPHGDTVVKIIFNDREQGAGPLDELIKILSK